MPPFLNTVDEVQIDDNKTQAVFTGPEFYNVSHFLFHIVNTTVFHAGCYKLYLRANRFKIDSRSYAFWVSPGVPNNFLLDANSSHIVQQNVTAGENFILRIQCKDSFGNKIQSPRGVLILHVTGSLNPRAPWLQLPPAASSFLGQTQSVAYDGWFAFDMVMQYSDTFILHFNVSNVMHFATLVVQAKQPPISIAISHSPTNYKIDSNNFKATKSTLLRCSFRSIQQYYRSNKHNLAIGGNGNSSKLHRTSS